MNRHNDLDCFIFEGRLTTQVVIACIDQFCQANPGKTVIVMDQAPIHTSQAIQARLAEWQAQQVEIFWLPRY